MTKKTISTPARTGRQVVMHLIAASVLILTVSSCTQEDDPYYSPLVGGWQLVDYSGPGTYYISALMLYGDGTGYVSGEDSYGYPQTWNVQWSSFSGRSLTIFFNDAYGTQWSYYYNFNGGELHMQPVDDISTEYWYMRY